MTQIAKAIRSIAASKRSVQAHRVPKCREVFGHTLHEDPTRELCQACDDVLDIVDQLQTSSARTFRVTCVRCKVICQGFVPILPEQAKETDCLVNCMATPITKGCCSKTRV